jgi:alpha-methylacyl-CoA racemase
MDEAVVHPHNVERGTFVEVDGVVQPSPAPRFGRTPSTIRRPPARAGEHTAEILTEWGLPPSRIEQLTADGVVA